MDILKRFLVGARSATAFRLAIIVAVTAAVVGFLLIHNNSGDIWAVMHGQIYFTDACWQKTGPWGTPADGCYKIPYKGVLIFSVLLVAVAAMLRYSGSSERK